MAHKAFEQFVRKQTKAAASGRVGLQALLAEWPDRLAELYTQVEGFMDPYMRDGRVEIQPRRKTVVEELLGQYEVEGRVITVGAIQVALDPVGVNVIGARGRVDLIGPYGQMMILLVSSKARGPEARIRHRDFRPQSAQEPFDAAKWAWKLVAPPPYLTYTELTPESFLDALLEVGNG